MDLQPIRTLLQRRHVQATHYDGCWAEHIDCAARVLLTEVERLRGAAAPIEHVCLGGVTTDTATFVRQCVVCESIFYSWERT